ncbi:MAG: RluA family pseudouridine synthase [Chitinophagaceae bacterium]|nr:RluA family pseudouridine synthase [Polaromonas sp.]
MKHIIEEATGQNPAVAQGLKRSKDIDHVTPQATAPVATFVTVSVDYAGQRLDNFLIRHLKGVPKTHVYRIIRSGEVRVNKGRAQADTRVETGDIVRLPPVRTSERADEKARAIASAQEVVRHGAMSTVGGFAPAAEFPILFEDDFLLAIDKPAGVAVHGGSGVSFGVIEQLRMARPESDFLELVHRLDRETSGILLIAKRRMALKLLQEQFRERETDKVYLALVSGHWPANHRVIDKALHKFTIEGGERHGERRVKVVANDHPDGLRSVTLVKVKSAIAANPLAPSTAFTLVEVTIKTGRTHQIRVHLANEGHPIAGDDKYGDFDLNKALQKTNASATPPATSLKRMFLHAWSLKFNHPKLRKVVHLTADLPLELQQFLPEQALMTVEQRDQ